MRVLLPNDPDSYYKSRELVPRDMMPDLEKAKIVITNYHAFKLRETMPLSKGGRRLLEGRTGEEIKTKESEGQMLQRVMSELMGMKNVLAINDEAHHCYREKPGDPEEDKLKGDDRKQAEKNTEAARLWISGLEAVKRKIGLQKVIDLSATPFFLNGSGYKEGTLFPWTVSDFSLMDAIECGIVKLPRVPIADNIPGDEMPMYRNLWDHIGKDMPKKGRGSAATLDPESLPIKLKTALEALYGHYEKTYDFWEQEGLPIPPCFIVVCNNTSTSKLVYDYLAGYERDSGSFKAGAHKLFRNYNEHGERVPKPRTLLIDSEQLESGDALDKGFRKIMAPEIDRFRREIIERTGNREQAEKISDQDLLREVMNTVGKQGRLGESIRCVVSVSMLTEGWDANTVTHVLGIRAFGTQLLCEQVVGRALRRQSYEINDEGLFNVEYADVLGIPFDFNAKPVIAPPQKPRPTIHVHAVSPERDPLEITFPSVAGYRVELPEETIEAEFNEESHLELTPELIGASQTTNQGIIGEAAELNLQHTEGMRKSSILFHLAKYLVETHYRDPNGEPKMYLFGQLKRVARQWLDNYFTCKGGTTHAQLCYREIANLACQKIVKAINLKFIDERPTVAILDPYNRSGSTAHVNFRTSKELRYETSPNRSHVNWVIGDSKWELAFAEVVERHPKVHSYVKNQGMGFEVPYQYLTESRRYIPDFIVRVDDGHGEDDLLNLIVEIKGYRGEDAKEKKSTMDSFWIPGVNYLKTFGRWAFAEFRDVWTFGEEFDEAILTSGFAKLIDQTLEAQASDSNR